jgi:hypothetical protein
MDARFQQFFNTDADHNFPLVKNSPRVAATNHPAEHGIEFDVVMARLRAATARQTAFTRMRKLGRFSLPADHSASGKGI